ncbi:CarD family transcriptional regulator [Siccirubricoccus sp. G192]|uniref:CarD family transcriptional regulator n=1 Tax=Siccirubricoccus sp. G192 TaxID=2849651 RepID=UPI001C2BF28D|nr:CarD family transcriptional regulator [Siccirubricoccus sp. G192]MBV1796915.1 hypothetical protein [Siccirubricoccus sp. G192]
MPRRADGWPALRQAPPGSFALLDAAPGPEGFEGDDAVVVPFATIRPGASAPAEAGARDSAAALLEASAGLQPGDAVIHLDHGLGALRGVEAVDTGEARLDCLRLDYADAIRLVSFDELDRLWRYGAEAESRQATPRRCAAPRKPTRPRMSG